MQKSDFLELVKNWKSGTSITFGYEGDTIEGKIQKEDRDVYVCHDDPSLDGFAASDKLGYKYSICSSAIDLISNVKRLKKDLYSLEIGDVVVSGGGYEYIILAVIGGDVNPVYLVSRSVQSLEEAVSNTFYTAYELKKFSYTIKDQPEKKQTIVTLEEIAKWKGCKVEDVRVKDKKRNYFK